METLVIKTKKPEIKFDILVNAIAVGLPVIGDKSKGGVFITEETKSALKAEAAEKLEWLEVLAVGRDVEHIAVGDEVKVRQTREGKIAGPIQAVEVREATSTEYGLDAVIVNAYDVILRKKK